MGIHKILAEQKEAGASKFNIGSRYELRVSRQQPCSETFAQANQTSILAKRLVYTGFFSPPPLSPLLTVHRDARLPALTGGLRSGNDVNTLQQNFGRLWNSCHHCIVTMEQPLDFGVPFC